MTKYNGHKNYNHWNVCLYLFNEYPIYCKMVKIVNGSKTRDEAARAILSFVRRCWTDRTPDGVRWTYSAVRAAITNWNK
jgi:hypothetical protein